MEMQKLLLRHESHPSRGAWIEIEDDDEDEEEEKVAPLAGCVD